MACIRKVNGSDLHTLCSFVVLLSDLWVDDEAVYVCEAQNQFGKIEAKARITVTGLGR